MQTRHRPACRLHDRGRSQDHPRCGTEETDMTIAVLKTATEEEFFERGRALARLADAAEPIPEEHIVSFEELADLLSLSMPAHLA